MLDPSVVYGWNNNPRRYDATGWGPYQSNPASRWCSYFGDAGYGQYTYGRPKSYYPCAYTSYSPPYEIYEWNYYGEFSRGSTAFVEGWDEGYNFFDHREQPVRGEDWIGQDVDAQMVGHYEAWRFYTSGQFNQLRAVGADWRESAEISSAPPSDERVIEVWEILFYVTEVLELAARLALSPAGDETMTIDVGLHGLDGRGLIGGQPNRAPFFEPYRTSQNKLQQRVTVLRSDLVAEPRDHAVDIAHEFFVRFGWKPARDQLAEHQRELTARS